MRFSVSAAMLLMSLAACSHVTTGSNLGARHPWTTPHVLRVAEPGDPDRLNPYLSMMDVTYDVSSLVYSYLVVSDDRGRLIGDLATDVPTKANGGISLDGLTYTYRLHRGVRWHDGARFTSRDVVASWRAIINPRNQTVQREGFDQIARIDTPDDATVVVHLRKRYPPFVSLFFAPLQEAGKPVLPAHILERERDFNTGTLASHPIGTGPFRFVSWQRGARIVLERNPAYFKGMPKLTRIEIEAEPDGDTMLAQMQTHHVDLAMEPQYAHYALYRAIPGVTTMLTAQNAQIAIMFNARKPVLHDASVRQAISYAIDRRVLIDKITQGVGAVVDNSLSPTTIGYEHLTPHPYDTKHAIALLHGAHPAFTLAIMAGSPTAMRAALVIQSELHAAGIDMAIKTYPYHVIFSPDGPIYRGTFDAALYGTTINWDPNVLDYLGCTQWFPKGANTFGYCNPQLDALETAGLQTEDTSTRAAVYRKASVLIWNDLPYLPLYEYRRLNVYNSDLQHYSVNATSTPWWNAWRWDI